MSIMAYGRTPYVGMAPKKNGGHIKSPCKILCVIAQISANFRGITYLEARASIVQKRVVSFYFVEYTHYCVEMRKIRQSKVDELYTFQAYRFY